MDERERSVQDCVLTVLVHVCIPFAAVGVKRGALAAVQYEMHTFQIEKEGLAASRVCPH